MHKYRVCIRVREGDLIKFKLLNFYAKDHGQAVKNAYNRFKYEFDEVRVLNVKMVRKYNGVFIDNVFSIFTLPLMIIMVMIVIYSLII